MSVDARPGTDSPRVAAVAILGVMPSNHAPLLLLADAVLVVHFAIVVFIVGGLAAILVGNARGWRWVNGFWFRWIHVAAIAIVVAQSWLGQACALTTLESWLRREAGGAGYEKSFIEHWVQRVMFYEAPFWVFVAAYAAFAIAVLATWIRFPPRRRRAREPRRK